MVPRPQIAFRNRDWEFPISFRHEDQTALDITGSVWALAVRSMPGLNPPQIIGTPTIFGNPANGELRVAIPAASMNVLPGKYYAELYRIDSGSDVVATWRVVIADEGEVFPGDVIARSRAIQIQ